MRSSVTVGLEFVVAEWIVYQTAIYLFVFRILFVFYRSIQLTFLNDKMHSHILIYATHAHFVLNFIYDTRVR